MSAIVVSHLKKSYGATRAINDISLAVDSGEFVALIGPNGAGKTTTVELLEGHRRRDEGVISVLGLDPGDAADFRKLRARIGVVLQANAYEPSLRVKDLVARQASYYREVIAPDFLIDALGLGSSLGTRVGRLSGGTRRRVDILLALLGRPDILFLDEPTSSLDPQSRERVHALLDQVRSWGTSIVLTSHQLDEVEQQVDTVHVIVGGAIRTSGTPSALISVASANVVIEFDAPPTHQDRLPAGWEKRGSRLRYATEDPNEMVRDLRRWEAVSGADLSNLSIQRPTLDDVYAYLITETEPVR